MKALFLTLVVALQSFLITDARSASDEELEAIHEALHPLELSDRRLASVLSIEGETIDGVLHGAVFFRPLLIYSKLCLMEEILLRGKQIETGYEWGKPDAHYFYWNSDRGCEIETRDEMRMDSVIAVNPMPSTDIVRIFRDADRLLEEAILRFRPSSDFFADPYFQEFWAEWRLEMEPAFRDFFEREFVG